MILLLDTAGPTCRLTLIDGSSRLDSEWEANRQLAKGLLGHIEAELQKNSKIFSDLSGIGVLKGPGSFTGLRIGITVANTLADALTLPIIGESGEDWKDKAVRRLRSNENEQIILPMYGSEAIITKPRK